jgi:hypothetical protein
MSDYALKQVTKFNFLFFVIHIFNNWYLVVSLHEHTGMWTVNSNRLMHKAHVWRY